MVVLVPKNYTNILRIYFIALCTVSLVGFDGKDLMMVRSFMYVVDLRILNSFL